MGHRGALNDLLCSAAVLTAWSCVNPQVSAAVQPVVQKVSDAASHASEYALSALANATASFR